MSVVIAECAASCQGRFICFPPLLQAPFEDQDESIHSELECLFFCECTEV